MVAFLFTDNVRSDQESDKTDSQVSDRGHYPYDPQRIANIRDQSEGVTGRDCAVFEWAVPQKRVREDSESKIRMAHFLAVSWVDNPAVFRKSRHRRLSPFGKSIRIGTFF